MENTNTQIQSKIITQEMVEGKSVGVLEKVLRKIFRMMAGEKKSEL